MREVQKLVLPNAVGRSEVYMFPKSQVIYFGIDFGRPAMWYIADPYNDDAQAQCSFLITYDNTALEPEWRIYHGTVRHPELLQHLHLFQWASLNEVQPLTFGGRLVSSS